MPHTLNVPSFIYGLWRFRNEFFGLTKRKAVLQETMLHGRSSSALIGLIVYSFSRVGAALGMKVEDVFVQIHRLRVRLNEKGSKQHEMPCDHNLEEYLAAYLDDCACMKTPGTACPYDRL